MFERITQFIITVVVFVVGIATIATVEFLDKPGVEAEAKPTLYPPKTLQYFTFGYNEIVADALWLRTIQDFDYCETRPVGVYNPKFFKCTNGWVYQMIDTVTELAPRFRIPYISGGLLLNVVVNDIPGASKIFDKAVLQFPTDWSILYNAAFQALSEEKNEAKAAALLRSAGLYGAPAWTISLAARLHQKAGQLEFARSVLAQAISTETEDYRIQFLKKRLDEVDAEIANQPIDRNR